MVAAAAVGRRWKSAKRRSAQRLAARQAKAAGGGLGSRDGVVAGGREKANGAELGRARRLWTPSIAGGGGAEAASSWARVFGGLRRRGEAVCFCSC